MDENEVIWIYSMAQTLVCEVMDEMSKIQLFQINEAAKDYAARDIHGVCALIDGDYSMKVRFFAEESLFERFAQRMMGCDPDDEELVRDYAMEYLNVVCGRFISEIINQTHIRAKLMPVKYEIPDKCSYVDDQETMYTLHFVSDMQEYASFSWTAGAIEEIVKRSKLNG